MTRPPGRWGRLLLALICGLVASAGLAPFGMWPLGLLGLVGGYLLIAAATAPRRAGGLGWALGLGYFAGAMNWLVSPFLVEPDRYGWMAPFALVLMAGGLALFWAAAAWLARWLAPGRRFWLAWPVSMTLAELARGRSFTGFPWGGPGEFWVDTAYLGLAGWIGATGLGFLTFLAAAWAGRVVAGPRRGLRLLVLVAGAGAGLAAGSWVLRQPIPPRPAPVTLRLVQPNAPQRLKWDPEYMFGFLSRAAALSVAPPAGPAPDVIIWPETSVPYLLNDAGPVLNEIAQAAAPARVMLGIQRTEPGPRYYNSLVVLNTDGSVAQLYDKRHLVPFGEYTPGGEWLYRFGIKGFAARYGGGYSAGKAAGLLDLGAAGKVLPLICYEAIFPGDLRAVPGRADWIVQITNDAWFGSFSGPQQHLAIARLRAAEFGLPLARAANTGISAVIDARGRVLSSLALGEAGFVDAPLPGALPPTLYARFGDLFLILLVLAVAVSLLFARRLNGD